MMTNSFKSEKQLISMNSKKSSVAIKEVRICYESLTQAYASIQGFMILPIIEKVLSFRLLESEAEQKDLKTELDSL